MIQALVIYAALIGPIDTAPTLRLTAHLGNDWRSRIARHELTCEHEWFAHRRLLIGRHYRIAFDEQALSEPTYQIGRGDEGEKLRPGTFSASGTFILTLESIAARDHWERQPASPIYWYYGMDQSGYRSPEPPEEFPPRPAGHRDPLLVHGENEAACPGWDAIDVPAPAPAPDGDFP